MKNISLKSLLIVALTVLWVNNAQPQSDSPSPTPLKLGVIRDEGEFAGNCGCSLYLNLNAERKRQSVFLSDMSENAVININGKDVKLQITNSSPEKKGAARVGDRSWEIYKAGNLKVRVDYVVRKLCDPKDEGCEVIYYKATITVTQKGQRAVINTIGLCGC